SRVTARRWHRKWGVLGRSRVRWTWRNDRPCRGASVSIAEFVDPKENRLFGMFPGILVELINQLDCRPLRNGHLGLAVAIGVLACARHAARRIDQNDRRNTVAIFPRTCRLNYLFDRILDRRRHRRRRGRLPLVLAPPGHSHHDDNEEEQRHNRATAST